MFMKEKLVMINFFRTVSAFHKNTFVNPHKVTIKHIVWQFRKIFNLLPCELNLGDFKIIIKNKTIANGCGGLINAMGYYDPNNMYFLEEIFGKGKYKVFLDIGANIGIYSLIVAFKQESSQIIAIEPHPFTYKLLKENISVNKFKNRIKAYQVGLSNIDGVINFTNEPGSTINKTVNIQCKKNIKFIQINVITGDSFCEKHSIIPDVIRIDVEGHENQVIEGFHKTLSSIKIILVECRDINKTAKLVHKMHNFLGPYKIDYKNRVFRKGFTSYEDWVFINAKVADNLNDISFRIEN